MDTAIQVHNQTGLSTQPLTKEQINLIKRTVAKGATDDELALFMHFCQQAGVDPLRKQAHFIKFDERSSPIMMIGIDGFQARATSDPRYEGLIAFAVYENDNFEMNPVTAEVHHTFKAKNRGKIVGAYAILRRKGMSPAIIWVNMNEYAMNRDNWRTKPDVMITKVARAALLRREYPDAFSGVYEPAEFGGEMTDEGDIIMPKDDEKPVSQPKVVKSEPKPEPEPEPPEGALTITQPTKDTVEIHTEDTDNVDGGEYPFQDVVDESMTPRDGLSAIINTAMYRQELTTVRRVIQEVNPDWVPGKMQPYHIPEGDVQEIVFRLSGLKLKRVERASKCKECGAKITKPEKEKQDGLCLDCWSKQG